MDRDPADGPLGNHLHPVRHFGGERAVKGEHARQEKGPDGQPGAGDPHARVRLRHQPSLPVKRRSRARQIQGATYTLTCSDSVVFLKCIRDMAAIGHATARIQPLPSPRPDLFPSDPRR